MDNLLTIDEVSKKDILALIDRAYCIDDSYRPFSGKVMTSFFMEPSTRTRLSFESAFARMGGSILNVTGAESSIAKNESINDSLRVISSYSDLLIARLNIPVQEVDTSTLECPLINAGDRDQDHPTQTLLDLFSMHKCFGKLEDLKICISGDLLYGRTVHSLIKVAGMFDWEVFLMPAQGLDLGVDYYDYLLNDDVKFNKVDNLQEILPEIDVLYMTRLQLERGATNSSSYVLDVNTIEKYASDKLRIFHPLPRNKELPVELDSKKYSYYFEQAKNGVAIRQAIISMMLGE